MPLIRLNQGRRGESFYVSRYDDVNGDDDQIVPIGASAHRSAKLIKGSTLKAYPGAPHGLGSAHRDQLNADLLAFLKS